MGRDRDDANDPVRVRWVAEENAVGAGRIVLGVRLPHLVTVRAVGPLPLMGSEPGMPRVRLKQPKRFHDSLVLLLPGRIGLERPQLSVSRRGDLQLPHSREAGRCRVRLFVVKFVQVQSSHATCSNVVNSGHEELERLCRQGRLARVSSGVL